MKTGLNGFQNYNDLGEVISNTWGKIVRSIEINEIRNNCGAKTCYITVNR
jgi:hypothetical protein